MSKATPMAKRQIILALYKKGHAISWISQTHQVSRTTIHSLVERYKTNGEEGLKPLYDRCGKPRPACTDLVFRAVRCMKTWHPGWGAEKIQSELVRMRPGLELPSVRTCYRWFRWNGQNTAGTKLPRPPGQWAKQLHEGWQIDAKEEMRTRDGNLQCWLNITDEHSGTVIDPPVFPL